MAVAGDRFGGEVRRGSGAARRRSRGRRGRACCGSA